MSSHHNFHLHRIQLLAHVSGRLRLQALHCKQCRSQHLYCRPVSASLPSCEPLQMAFLSCESPERESSRKVMMRLSAAWLADCLREMVEPFLYNAGVDIVLHGMHYLPMTRRRGC